MVILAAAAALIGLTVLATGCSKAAPTPTATKTSPSPTTTTNQTAEGKRLYDSSCAACHKATGEGGVKLGTATSADLRWPALGPTFKNDTALVRRAILEGLDEEGKPLDVAMPKFQGRLTDAQADQIIAYLQTLK